MAENHDLLTRIDERVDRLVKMLEAADIPARCASQSANLMMLKWAVGILAGAIVMLFGVGIKLLAE